MYYSYDIKLYTILHIHVKSSHPNFEIIMNVNRHYFLCASPSTHLFVQAGRSPLSFIFEETAYDSAKALFLNIVRQEGEEM